MDKIKILIVEDEPIFSNYLDKFLKKEGFDIVGVIESGVDAIKAVKEYKPDIILLDIMLKDKMSGCEASLEIRVFNSEVIIIFLSAHSTDEMLDYAINANASGYLMKPYRDKEILSTIKIALSKHKQEYGYDSRIINLKNGYIFDTKLNRLTRNSIEINLSHKSMKLIEVLSKNYGKTLSNHTICTYIWGENHNLNTLRSMIHRIKIQLNDDFIRNVNGFGYMIV